MSSHGLKYSPLARFKALYSDLNVKVALVGLNRVNYGKIYFNIWIQLKSSKK